MPSARLFWGVAVDHYASDRLPDLRWPTIDIGRIHHSLRDTFDGGPLLDADTAAVSDDLRTLGRGDRVVDHVVAVWSGHGEASPNGGVRLLATDSVSGKDSAGVSPGDVLTACLDAGASQVLLIVDTCYSGSALDAVASAAAILNRRTWEEGEPRPWVGVLSACSPDVTAADGVLAAQLTRVLEAGAQPRSQYYRSWSRHEEMVSGHDLCATVLEEWPDTEEQQPNFRSDGLSARMIPNRRFSADAPAAVVAHLKVAAWGGVDANRSWFTGRRVEVDRVVSWVTGGAAGLWVVTGSAGTGKSAILGRVVSASVPAERARLLEQSPGLGHADPGQGSVAAHAHARGLTVNQLARVLDSWLVAAERLPGADADRIGSELVGAVERAAETAGAGWVPPVIVVDGLDEARDKAFAIASELLVRLAAWCTLIVSTRNLPANTDSGPDLLNTLAPEDHRLDLDAPDVAARGQDAIRAYIISRLDTARDRMDAAMVAEHFLAVTDPVAGQPFLIARVMTDQLRDAPIDTALDGWQIRVSSSLGQAFLVDLAGAQAPEHRGDIADPAGWARALLAALTWGLGRGLPEDEWVILAAALTGREVDTRDITWVLDQLGRYVLQDGEHGRAVYRAAHQSLADHLRPPYPATSRAPFDPAALPVAEALLDRYQQLLAAGRPATEPGYLWHYAWRHAGSAGPVGLRRLREIAEAEPSLRYDVALTAEQVGGTLAAWGRHTDALPYAELIVATYRALMDERPEHRPDLAAALKDLGAAYSNVGRAHDAVTVGEESVALCRDVSIEGTVYLPELAMALSNLALWYGGVGRPHDAIAPIEEAVATYRSLDADTGVHDPALVGALTNLGKAYAEVGRAHEAIPPTEEAVDSYRVLAAEVPAYLADLAMAMNNLGLWYSGVGRPYDAVEVTEEAATIIRGVADENPVYRPSLATALSNLGKAYGEVGRFQDAISPTEEAIAAYRAVAADNPGQLSNLAMGLNNIGGWYGAVGRHRDAVPPIEESVALYRSLAEENPVHVPTLAMALMNLGKAYGEVGHAAEAIPPTEEAVGLYRDMVADNDFHQQNLARALVNLGNWYSGVGRSGDGLFASEEAIAIYRPLTVDNPAHLPALATALNNAGKAYSELGLPEAAIAPIEEALATYRVLAGDNPAHVPSLAMTLTNLSVMYSGIGRVEEAVAPADEAVATYRELAAGNPVHRANLALAMTNLARAYGEVSRPQDALVVLDEAVASYRELAADNDAHRVRLGRVLVNRAILLRDVDRVGDALPVVEEGVQIFRDLVDDGDQLTLINLAWALNTFELCAGTAGDPARFTTAWDSALAALPATSHPILWLQRAAAVDAGEPRALTWLVTAIAADPGDVVVGAIHEQVRRHRGPSPATFDAEWAERTGAPIPDWARLDPQLVAAAIGWIDTPNYDAEERWLTEHPELLAPHLDDVVEEALVRVGPEQAGRYRDLRAVARRDGVDVAYRPIRQEALAFEFLGADAARQRVLLTESGADLRSETVRNLLKGLAESADDADGADR